LPKFCNKLAGDDLEKKQTIQLSFSLIESLMRFLCDKNYYTIANKRRGMWALFVFYYIPQMACLISIYKKSYGIPPHIVNNDFMLPIMELNKLVSPTMRLKKYLITNVADKGLNNSYKFDTHRYLGSLKNNKTPRYQTKFRIINEIKNTDINPEKIQEIESIIDCAIFSSNVYQELCSYFGDKKHAYMLVEYFKTCLDICDKGLINAAAEIELDEDFVTFVLAHLDYTYNEFIYTKAERNSFGSKQYVIFKTNRDEIRNEFFHAFTSYLYETTSSEVDVLDNIDANEICKSILRYNPEHKTINPDKEHCDIVNLLKRLKGTFEKQKNGINENEIISILEEIKCHRYFSNYEHEFLYYNGLHYLAKNDFLNAIEQLKLVRKKCKEITAGETIVSASKLLIVLRLLTENTISYSHMNPEIQSIIDSQPEEIIFKLKENCNEDEDEEHKRVYLYKTLKLIAEFNANGYFCYNGFTCEKYNPLKKMDEFLNDFFEGYDDEKYNSDPDEIKIQKIIETLLKGNKPKYNIKRPIVAMFQFTIVEAFKSKNIRGIRSFNSDAKLTSKSMDRLLGSTTILKSLIQTIENL
jgi:hypothetical protein